MNIRNLYFSYRLKKRPQRRVIYHNYDDIRSVLILFESDLLERHLQVRQLIKELQKEGREVTAWGYVDKKEALTPVLRDFRVLSNRELNLMNAPKKTILEELERMHFDLVIDLTIHPDILPLRYLLMTADADIKAGRGGYPQPYLHDLLIDMRPSENDAAFLFDQIIKYLKIIRSANTATESSAEPSSHEGTL